MFSHCPYCGSPNDTGGKCWNPACLTQVATVPRVVPQDPLMTTVPWVTPGPTGWRCPVCGGGNAPWVGRCPCTAAGPPSVTAATAADVPPTKYPCARCGALRTKEEGGTTFTVCDACWDAGEGPLKAGLPAEFTCSRCGTQHKAKEGCVALYICAECWAAQPATMTYRVVGTVPPGHEGDFVNPKTELR